MTREEFETLQVGDLLLYEVHERGYEGEFDLDMVVEVKPAIGKVLVSLRTLNSTNSRSIGDEAIYPSTHPLIEHYTLFSETP